MFEAFYKFIIWLDEYDTINKTKINKFKIRIIKIIDINKFEQIF